MNYPSHIDHMRERYDRKWCVAPRLTDRLRAKGYDVAIPAKRYALIYRDWAMGHPAYQLALTLPDCPERDTILAGVLRELGA